MKARLHELDLLDEAASHFEKADSAAAASGEEFNIFNILGVGNLETRTHSPLLASLLNPRGKHGQGSAFLRLFLTHCRIADFDPDSARVATEVFAGPVTEKSGGRIDIVVRDQNKRKLVIENKIFAPEQIGQIPRTHNFAPEGHIFFLTLDGHPPRDPVPETVRCISYATEILAWLREAVSTLKLSQTVAATLLQYIRLLEVMTKQAPPDRNQGLITQISTDPKRLKHFFSLVNCEAGVQAKLVEQLCAELRGVVKRLGMVSCTSRSATFAERFGGMRCGSPALLARNLCICIEFYGTRYQGLYYGFARLKPVPGSPQEDALRRAFKAEFGVVRESSDEWPAWEWWDEEKSAWDGAHFEAIRSGQMARDWESKLTKLVKVSHAVLSAPPAN